MTKSFLNYFAYLFNFLSLCPTHNHPKDTKFLGHDQIYFMTICHKDKKNPPSERPLLLGGWFG